MITRRPRSKTRSSSHSAIGASTNAPIHMNAIARHVGVELTTTTGRGSASRVPLLVNLPARRSFLGEDYNRRPGACPPSCRAPRVGKLQQMPHRLRADLNENATRQLRPPTTRDPTSSTPMRRADRACSSSTKGNLFDSCRHEDSVIGTDFRDRYLADPEHPEVIHQRVVVFDGPEDYHARINDPALEDRRKLLLVIRGAGPSATRAPRKSSTCSRPTTC